MLLPSGLACIETPQVGHGRGAGEPVTGLGEEATGTGALVALAATAFCGSFDSGCSIRVNDCYNLKVLRSLV